ncbi:hypothetical protein GMW39_01320 [Pectobacterium parmentieri]|uniref:hypothetical protein n=1 Tax=Pectobacterium parmentieri TaxID=1905730 RepID=UPI001373D103|nr:hypothetical protein [Pectobacterium parmentieri]QHQ14636.1 hypothetical protein GMW39_01320 [Pectobacterium parmentieri]
MADDKLKTPVNVRAVSIKAVSLPVGFSPAYQQYVLSQAMDFTNVAGKANQAAGGAYDAQVRNDEQDVILKDHEQRLDVAEATLADHEGRITANTNAISLLTVRVTTAEGKIVTLQSDVSFLLDEVVDIQADMVSRSSTATQSLSSSLDVTDELLIDGVKVIGPRQTGWTAATGSAYRGTFNSDETFPVSDPPTQSEMQAIAAALTAERKRTKALEDALRAHGLIN